MIAGAIACLAAAFVVVQLPYLALFPCAVVLAEMSCRGKSRQAAFMAGATAAASGVLWGPSGAVFAAIGLVGVLVAVALHDRVDPWRMLIVLAAGYAASFIAVDVAGSLLSGDSFIEGLRVAAQTSSTTAVGTVGSLGVTTAVPDAQTVSQTLFTLWPATYAASAFVTALAVMSGVGRAMRSHGAKHALPPLSKIDVSPHVLWLPIVGVSLLVAGELVSDSAVAAKAIGSNILVAAWPVFAWQGFAVVAERLERLSVPIGGRVVTYASVIVFEALLFAASLLGFVDIVANFRRLDRQDASSQDGAGDPASSS